MKYTPGPWELDSAKIAMTPNSRYQIIHGQIPKGINQDWGYPVADTLNRHYCITPEEDEANAKLIAKAPEMAELLTRYVIAQEFGHGLEGFLDDVKNVLNEAGAQGWRE